MESKWGFLWRFWGVRSCFWWFLWVDKRGWEVEIGVLASKVCISTKARPAASGKASCFNRYRGTWGCLGGIARRAWEVLEGCGQRYWPFGLVEVLQVPDESIPFPGVGLGVPIENFCHFQTTTRVTRAHLITSMVSRAPQTRLTSEGWLSADSQCWPRLCTRPHGENAHSDARTSHHTYFRDRITSNCSVPSFFHARPVYKSRQHGPANSLNPWCLTRNILTTWRPA